MSSAGTLLITGATGEMGLHFLKEALKTNFKILVLCRPSSISKTWIKTQKALELLGENPKKITVLKGDFTLTNLCLSTTTINKIKDEITHVIHAGATTEFSVDLEEARLTNVVGTKNILELLKKCKSLQKVAYISTVYVSGKRTGTIKEDELKTEKFVNSYEQSKFEAEQLIHTYMPELPIAIYRMSTAIGDSKTGYIHNYNAVHRSIKLMYSGLAPMIPGITSINVEIIPSDYAAAAIWHIFNNSFARSQTYHIVAQNSTSLQDFLHLTKYCFEKHNPNWKSKGISMPIIVDQKTFELFELSVIETNDVVMSKIINSMKYFLPHLSLVSRYQTDNFDKAVAKKNKSPSLSSYYPNIIRQCIKNWPNPDG